MMLLADTIIIIRTLIIVITINIIISWDNQSGHSVFGLVEEETTHVNGRLSDEPSSSSK